MFNLFIWLRSRFNDWLFYRAFDRVPVTHLGVMLVKDFRGALYCVGFDEVRLRTLEVLRNLPRDGQYLPVLALIEQIEAAHD